MQSLINKIKSWNWKVYVGAMVAGALGSYRAMHPEATWCDYALTALAALGFAVSPSKKPDVPGAK